MSGRHSNKAGLPSSVVEILEEFKAQRSATRPRIGVGNRNYFLYGQPGAVLDDDSTHGVRTRLSFDTSQIEMTETLEVSTRAPKRRSDTVESPDIKRVAASSTSSPAGSSGIDWSPASREQRSRLLETVDSRINDLQTLVTKNEEFKRQLQQVMDNEKLSLQRQRERDKESMRHLREEVQSAKDKAFELEQELIKKKSQYREIKINSEQEIQCLENEKADLDLQLRELRHELRNSQMELSLQLESCQGELELAQGKCMELEDRTSQLEEELLNFRERESREEALQASLTASQQRVQGLEIELAATKSKLQQQRRESGNLSSGTVRHVKELEEQLIQSREMLRGKLLLEETVGTLRTQLASSSHLTEQLATQQELNKRKDAELAEWHTLATQLTAGEGGSTPSPRAMTARVQQLEQSLLVLRADMNEVTSQLTTKKQEKAQIEMELRSEQSRSKALQATSEAQAATLKKLDRKLQLITKERDCIQAVLTAYEGDVTMVGGQLNAMQRSRIESAENSARELRAMLEEREKELAEMKGSPGDQRSEVASLQEKLQMQSQEMEKEKVMRIALEERCERLELLLEQRAMRGDYDPSTTRVLHHRMNPQAVESEKRAQDMTQLKESNDKLRERVRVLEAAAASGSVALNTTNIVEENLQLQSNKELQELREKVKQLETKSQRLVECFRKTSTSFRQAIYLLFGYKTDALNDNNYRLTSLYAEREEDHLLFKILEGDSIEMVQTAFSDSVPELIRTHLEEQGSVPAFLSALTLDLYGRQTFTS